MKLSSKLIFAVLIAAGLHLLIYFSGVIPFFDYRFYDLTNHIRFSGSPAAASSTVVVEIDETSLRELGQWPWPRILLAGVLREIFSQQPAAVAFDILFPENDRTSPVEIKAFYRRFLSREVDLEVFPRDFADHDRIFADVLRSGPTVLPVYASAKSGSGTCFLLEAQVETTARLDQLPGADNLLCNIPVLQQAAGGIGYINAQVDPDGIFRRQPLLLNHHGKLVPNLVLAMLAQVDPQIRILPTGNIWGALSCSFLDRGVLTDRHGELLNPLYPQHIFSRVSATQLLAGTEPSDLFTGKLVLIGATAAGLFDQYATPTGDVLPGVYIHAALLENILQGRGLYQPENSRRIAFVLSLVLSAFLVWLVFERHYLLSWGVYILASVVILLAVYIGLGQGVYLSAGYFLTPFSFHFFSISLFFAVLHYVERKRFLEDLGAAHSATIDSMTMVAESRDVETGAHIVRTKEYVRLLAEHLLRSGVYRSELNNHFIDLLYRAAPLHDIGKVGIPDAILQKPGRLNEEEMLEMQKHVVIGQKIIENAISSYNKTNEFLSVAANIVYSHHEKWDGSGYPLGLEGTDIPLEGRLMALADVYDALISIRCYKNPFSFATAEETIFEENGRHFDPRVIDAFRELRFVFRDIAEKTREDQERYHLADDLWTVDT